MEIKKLTKEELSSLRSSLTDFNKAKIRLADAVVHQEHLVSVIKTLKQKFAADEDMLLQKYGQDCRINLESGEVIQKEKEKQNG
jgi:hypothetical protein|tara:strand:+ start:280 stop:531 length:252 start_codon:yes stop_codon:yes gene_type:complete